MNLNQPHEALQYFDRAQQIKEKTSSDVDTDRNFATTLHDKGRCLLDLNEPHEAIQYFNRAIQIDQKRHMMSTLTGISPALFMKKVRV